MNVNHLSKVTKNGLILAAFAAIPTVGWSAPPDRPTPPAPPAAVDAAPDQTVDGTVAGFNRDPRGHINSIVLKTADGKLDQFNLPPDLGDVAMRIAADGQKVTAAGSPERAVGDRTIYRLTKLTGTDGKSSLTAPTPGVPEPTETIEGTVRQLNVSGHGEVDGALLDSGDFVHTGVEAGVGLTIGGKLSATGVSHPMADGHRAVDADQVNGHPVPRPPVRPEAGPHPKPGPDGMTPPAPPQPPTPDAVAPKPPVPPAGR